MSLSQPASANHGLCVGSLPSPRMGRKMQPILCCATRLSKHTFLVSATGDPREGLFSYSLRCLAGGDSADKVFAMHHHDSIQPLRSRTYSFFRIPIELSPCAVANRPS